MRRKPYTRENAVLLKDPGDTTEKRPENFQGLVCVIAKRYAKVAATQNGMSLDDLLQEGQVGVLKALKTFKKDPSMLSNYVAKSITNHIRMAVGWKAYRMSIPPYMGNIMSIYRRILRRRGITDTVFVDQETFDSVTEEMNLKKSRKKNLLSALEAIAFHTENVPRSAIRDPGYLEEIHDGFEDEHEDSENIDQVASAMAMLTRHERQIINGRFGLKTRDPKTLDEVGKEIGVTRERVRQCEHRALARLRKFWAPTQL